MTWDAIVIGAGPAGSVAAREIALRGRRVLLVDKTHFPRQKVCGCCLNRAAIRTLERLGLDHVLEDAAPIDRITISAGKRSADISLHGSVAISREVFDARLVAAAVNAGVEFRPGFYVARGDRTFLSQARVVVVATGISGGDAPPNPHSRIGAGVLVPVESSPSFYSQCTIFMAVGVGGYVGLVRVEDGRLDVAAAFDAAFVKTKGGPGLAAEATLRSVGWPVPHRLAELSWKGTPALTRRPEKLAGDRQFLVGDAAGYVEPFTGEGIAWAVMSAAALAPLAVRAIHSWHDELIREWEADHARVVGRRQRFCRVVSRVLRSPQLTGLAVRALGVFPFLSRPVVAALNRPSYFPRAPFA